MKAISVVPGTKTVRLVDRPVPSISAADEIKVRVLRVGICGTDREEAAGGRAQAPPSHKDLVLGHEMFGQVVETGRDVKQVKSGDYAVFTVRRGCGKCRPCAMNRSDMCKTGLYSERGIAGMDGYQTEYVVDHEQYVVRVPPELEAVGVLAEPFSVAEKAIGEAVQLQTIRLPHSSPRDWLSGKRCLVAGLGPIGLLAALALRLRGAEVWGLDVVDASTVRPRWLHLVGGHYIDGRQITPDHFAGQIELFDLILEATGISSLEFDLIDALAINGVYAVTGIPSGDRPLKIDGAEFMRRLVLRNQVLVGSVNASRDHFQLAVNDLVQAKTRWHDHVADLITQRHNYTEFENAFQHHGSDEIKVVLEWGGGRVPPEDKVHQSSYHEAPVV
jgi:glucose 1-dehydrogenase